MENRPHVDIYTDGACDPNPGSGGYAAILKTMIERGEYSKEFAGGFRLTTNNRMELLAPIIGLEALKKPSIVTVCSDSRYVVDGMSKGWAHRWRNNGWHLLSKKRNQGKGAPVKNPDLWERLLTIAERHEVTFQWLKGHSGHPENERCDELAVWWASQANLPEDEGHRPNATPSYTQEYPTGHMRLLERIFQE